MAEPTDPIDASFNRALGWLRGHLFNHAEITFRKVLAARPDDRTARRLWGIALCQLGRRTEGIAAIREALDGAPGGNARAWADLAVALRDDDQPHAAAAAYAEAGRAQTPDAPPPPPLESVVFCTDLGRHEFTLVDYSYQATIRYGAGRPSHPELAEIIGAGRARYAAFLDDAADLQPDLAELPLSGVYETREPFWLNSWFSGLDAIALSAILKRGNPQRFLEVGSGVSTKFARRAIERYGLATRVTSIDPEPRNDVDALCDEVIRQPLERCDLARFAELQPGDICFLDSSHRSFQNSDVTVFFLEVLPRLKPGVLVHIHDIYLPDDYIAGHVDRLWNEQYLLATALLFGADRFEILFPSWFAMRDPELKALAERLFRKGPMAELDLYGVSFWMTKRR